MDARERQTVFGVQLILILFVGLGLTGPGTGPMIPVFDGPVELVATGFGWGEGPAYDGHGALWLTDLADPFADPPLPTRIMRYDGPLRDCRATTESPYRPMTRLFMSPHVFAMFGECIMAYDVGADGMPVNESGRVFASAAKLSSGEQVLTIEPPGVGINLVFAPPDEETLYMTSVNSLFRVPLRFVPDSTPLWTGDANQDLSFDQFDLVQVLQAGRYALGVAAQRVYATRFGWVELPPPPPNRVTKRPYWRSCAPMLPI